jgi:hypothetical protein
VPADLEDLRRRETGWTAGAREVSQRKKGI